MGDRAQREAWVTLATNDAYALGCMVVGNSLRRVNTTRQLVVMLTDGVSESMRYQLGTVFDSLVDVSVLDSEDARNLSLLGRPDLNVTYTKIHCWELTQYEKGVFLDADTLVLQNCDELFDREELSAAPDAGWPDCFNSGVFVFRPSLETYNRICDFVQTTGSFDGGDQGLLNSFFNTWSTADISKHLPFIYNVVSQAFYSYLPAFTQFRDQIKIVHFIGPIKPWHHPYNTATKTVTVFPETGHCKDFLQMWWDLFVELVQPRLDPTLWLSYAKPYIMVNLTTGESTNIIWLFMDGDKQHADKLQGLVKPTSVTPHRVAQLMKKEVEKGDCHTPFIRYEYILPTSHPPPSPSQHDTEKAQCQGQQPSSYQVLYPYVPPALNQEFYIPPEPHPHWEPTLPSHPSPPCPQPYQHGEYSSGVDQAPQEPHQDSADGGGQEGCQDGVEVPHVVDMPIIDRSFHPYETHYVEEPLLLIDPDSPSPVLYESSHFEQKLTEETEKAKAAEKEGELVISVADDSVQDSQDLTDMKSGDIDASKTSQVGRSGDAGDGRKAVSPSEKHTGVSSSQVKENGHVGGLVGELAQMKIAGSGESADYVILDDRERRLAWERGHADYLGADSFENIMKKLDEKMAPIPANKEKTEKASQSSQSEASLTKPELSSKKD